MTVSAKFKVSSVEDFGQFRVVKLAAVSATSEENMDWSKWTPSGKIEMSITNPDAFNQFAAGDDFYLTFTKAENVSAAA